MWPFIAARHGLAATLVDPTSGGSYTDRRQLVKLRKVDVGPGMDRLLLALPVGTDSATLLRASEGLAHSLRASAVRVRTHKPGRVWVDVIRRDTLAPHPATAADPGHERNRCRAGGAGRGAGRVL